VTEMDHTINKLISQVDKQVFPQGSVLLAETGFHFLPAGIVLFYWPAVVTVFFNYLLLLVGKCYTPWRAGVHLSVHLYLEG
jgi:hypothetical protein